MALNIPQGYQQVMPYLILKDPQRFIDFTARVFGAKGKTRQMKGDKIGHAEILIGENCIMFGGSTEDWSVMTAGLFIYVEDADATYQKAMEAGAETVMELSDQGYGRTCGVKDPEGNTWWITSVK
ncbi:MAG TPA: VOC family protein [Flavipsychrobacter sp.]|nr:VOC family protein [Flavipsychrobacter sp.]